MGRGRIALAGVVLAALGLAGTALSAGRSTTPIRQEFMIAAADGTELSCGLVEPPGAPPAGGWPGVLLFPGPGRTHLAMETLATGALAPAGFAALSCDERGTGASGGAFDLAGPTDVQDVRDLFAWLAARPEVSDTEIGAYGESVGGGEVWNATAAGVPFAAIAPAGGWTSLDRALAPHGVAAVGNVAALAQAVPGAWDAALAQAREDLEGGAVTPAVDEALAARSSRSKLHSLAVPALILQNRHDLLFDIAQSRVAYRLLAGPKRLYVGDLAHSAAKVPPYFAEVVAWFEQYLAGGAKAGGGVELAHHPADGTTTRFPGLPPTRSVSVNLPARTVLSGGDVLRLSVRLPGGPLETFGGGSVTVRYSDLSLSPAWTQLAASVSLKGSRSVVTEGAAPVATSSAVLTIPLRDEAAFLPLGKRLVVTIGGSSPDGIFRAPAAQAGGNASIRIRRVTLKLSILQRAVSR